MKLYEVKNIFEENKFKKAFFGNIGFSEIKTFHIFSFYKCNN